ncbi:hypothetical protein AB0J83_13220 [Actinoplanes sp. NPDC049596]|uniref:hypothetical protein n=1 Tax=unclassified Actinoplanes TaxID=2626549 RepID=UPI0034469F8E
MRKSVKNAVIAGVAVVAVGGAATAAWAAWNVTGTGTAQAVAESALNLKTVETTTDATLYPGATGKAIIKIENPNKFPVEVTTLKWNPNDGVQATPLKGKTCGNTGVYFGDFSNGPVGTNGLLSGLHLTVDAKDTASFELPNAVHMINNSEDGCQGATFSIKVAISGASAAK